MTRTILSRSASALAGCAALVVLAGCGGGSSSTASPPANPPSSTTSSSGSAGTSSSAPSSGTAMITIKNFAFQGPSSVKPGTKIMVMNEDSEAHTVTADGAGGFNVKVDPGKTATFTAPTKPGSYPYHCIYHSNMHGTLKVG